MGDLLSTQSKLELPYAIGHRGFGRTRGQTTVRDIPTENTIESVVMAFEAGVRVVEVDVVITANGDAFIDHDDYLENYTCLNKLSTKDLETLLPESVTLKKLLKAVRPYAKRQHGDLHPKGLMILEVKTPSPLCDPLDETEVVLMEAVIADIYEANMVDQVKIQSFSPSLVQIAGSLAPEIDRMILLNGVQLLSVEEVEELVGAPVLLIDKEFSMGLQWTEIFPKYRSVSYSSISQFLETAIAIGVTELAIDKLIFFEMEATDPGTGAKYVAQLQSMGFLVNAWTVEILEEWPMLASMGIDGIITDFIEEGVELQGN